MRQRLQRRSDLGFEIVNEVWNDRLLSEEALAGFTTSSVR